MKLRLISMLIASSMAAGNFTMPVSTAAMKDIAPLMHTGSTEYILPIVGTDDLTDGSPGYPEIENYDNGISEPESRDSAEGNSGGIIPEGVPLEENEPGLISSGSLFEDSAVDALQNGNLVTDIPAGGEAVFDGLSDGPAAGEDASGDLSDSPAGDGPVSDGFSDADALSDTPAEGVPVPDDLTDNRLSGAFTEGNPASDNLSYDEGLSGTLTGGDPAPDNLSDDDALSDTLAGEEPDNEDLTEEIPADENLMEEELPVEDSETLEEEDDLIEDDQDDEDALIEDEQDDEEDEEDPEEEDPEKNSEELDEESDEVLEEALGGYEFAGYLYDLIPNYVWVGEGEPSRIGHEYLLGDKESRAKELEGDSAEALQDSGELPSLDDSAGEDSAAADDDEAEEPLYSNILVEEFAEDAPADFLPYTDSNDSELIGETMSFTPLSTGTVPMTMNLASPIIGDELVTMDFGTQSTVNAPMMAPAVPPLVGASGGNYIADTVKRVVYQGYKSRSTTVDSSMSDGLHTISSGKVRIYKDGRYFINGGIALDGQTYYADENGYLIGGWLKTIMDSSNSDYQNEKNDMAFSFRYFDRSSYKMQTGLVKVDGLWHYFNDNGAMIVNKANTINGNYYYSDRYGICERVKLRFGNVIISDANQNNNTYLANKAVTAVDINTFTGQNGEYSFRPRWYKDLTSLEVFGFNPVENSEAYYCTLRDGSLAGKIGCIYRNVGKYNGRAIDLRLTVTGYEFFNLNGDNEVGYFYVAKGKIGLNACNTRNITADMEFLDHETGRAVSLKGYATFSDIDISQSVSILSPVDNVYVDKNCALYKDPASMTFTAPFTASRVGSVVNDPDREYWVQVNYTGTHLKFRFGSAYEQYVFADSGLNISGEARDIWNKSYSGNPADYSIEHDGGLLHQSWQGLHYRRLGRISIPPVSKTVSDQDEKDVTDNRLKEDELNYTYTLSHNVPAESSEYYYSSYKVSDVFENGLIIQSAGIRVHDDAGADVTERFDISVSGQRVDFSGKAVFLAHSSFYDNNYHYTVPVTIRDVSLLEHKDGEDRVIYNKCTAGFTRPSGPEEKTSNTTTTRIRIPYSFGDITITKRILEKDIVWAHGNPTFLFCAEGTDEKGVRHRYEEYICFSRGKYSVNSGYAVLSTTIRHVPAGVYRVWELPVIDYYLTGAQALTSNMTITRVSDPGRGKDPSQVAYGSCTLTRTNPNAGIAFTNAKGDYHGLRHTSVVQNNIPVAFDTKS